MWSSGNRFNGAWDESIHVCGAHDRDMCSKIQENFPVAQLVEHGASNAKIMGSIPRESKSW